MVGVSSGAAYMASAASSFIPANVSVLTPVTAPAPSSPHQTPCEASAASAAAASAAAFAAV